jgi:hypothetical protein
MPRRAAALALLAAVVALAAAPAPALAHSVADDLTIGGSQATATDPRSLSVTERLIGTADINDKWTLRLDASYTHDFPAPPAPGDTYANSGGNFFNIDVGALWEATRHFTFTLDGFVAPQLRATSTNAPITVDNGGGTTDTYDGRLTSHSLSGGGILSASYDTDGDSKVEHSAGLTFGTTYLDTREEITAIYSEQRMRSLSDMEIAKLCTSPTTLRVARFCSLAGTVGKPREVSLFQFRLAADYTLTLYDDSDLGVVFAYYLYDQDPTGIGYFSLTPTSRQGVVQQATPSQSATEFKFGDGIALAPYQFTASVNFTQRVKKFSGILNFQFAQYLVAQGDPYAYNLTASLKLQYKFTPLFRLYLKVTGQRDLVAGEATYALYGTLGAKFTF